MMNLLNTFAAIVTRLYMTLNSLKLFKTLNYVNIVSTPAKGTIYISPSINFTMVHMDYIITIGATDRNSKKENI